jgi:hypothetical protein
MKRISTTAGASIVGIKGLAKYRSDEECMETDEEILLDRLPDSCSLRIAEYHSYVIKKVREGLRIADTDGAVSFEDVEQRLGKWLTK